MIVGVDPDTRALGWCVITNEGVLFKCGLVRAKNLEAMLKVCCTWANPTYRVCHLTVERPQLYGLKDRANPNKIGQLLTIGGRVSATYPKARLRMPFPNDWKGQTPKTVHNARVISALDPVSLARLRAELHPLPKSLQHNVIDAVGLAYWTLGKIREQQR